MASNYKLADIDAEINRRKQAQLHAVEQEIARRERAAEGAIVGRGKDVASNINTTIANYAGLPFELVNHALRSVGLNWAEKPGDIQASFRNGFKSAGLIDEFTVNDLWSKFGKAVGDNIPVIASMGLGAGPMTLVKGAGAIPTTVRSIGKEVISNPGRAAALEIGAIAGGTVGEDLGGPAGALAGSFAGAGVGTVATGLGKTVVSPLVSATRRVTGSGAPKTPISPDLTEPVRPPGLPDYARSTAKSLLDQDLDRIEADVQGIFDAVPTTGTPKESQIALRRATESAQKVARVEENRYWEKVALQRPVATDAINTFAASLRAEAKNKQRSIPEDAMEMIANDTTVLRKNGTRVPIKVPLEKLRALRTDIRDLRLGHAKTPGYKASKNREYIRLENAILESMKAGLTGKQLKNLEDASQFSDDLNSSFRQGPIGRMLAVRDKTGEMRVKPGQSFTKLRNEYEPTEAIQGVQAFSQRVATAGKTPVPAEALTVEAEAENTIRNMFRAEAQNAPGGPPRWLEKNERLVKPLARVYTELQDASTRWTQLQAEKVALQRSALTKYTEANPDAAIRSIMNNPDPAKSARQILGRIGADKEAVEGFQASIIDELVHRANGKGANLLNLLDTPRIYALLDEALDATQIARLNKIATAASQVESGKERLVRRGLKVLGSGAAAITGGYVGRLLGTGTLQAPAVGSKLLKTMFDESVARAPMREILKQVVLDPRSEKVLLAAAPRTVPEAKLQLALFRRVIAAHEGLRQRGESRGENIGVEGAKAAVGIAQRVGKAYNYVTGE